MSDSIWAKLWFDLPDKPKVRREVREHGGDALWLWAVCIIRSKASCAGGRIEVERGVPATRDELRDFASLQPKAFDRALAVLLRWGADSKRGWLVIDPDGAYRARNLPNRQSSAEAQRKAEYRDKQRYKSRDLSQDKPQDNEPDKPRTCPGTSPGDVEEEVEVEVEEERRKEIFSPQPSPDGDGAPPKGTPKAQRGHVTWDGSQFGSLTDADLTRFKTICGGDPSREIARCAAHWNGRTLKDPGRALSNWMKGVGPSNNYTDRRTLAEQAWLRIVTVINGYETRHDSDAYLAGIEMLDADDATKAALAQFGADTQTAVEFLREAGVTERGRHKPAFISAHVASQEAGGDA